MTRTLRTGLVPALLLTLLATAGTHATAQSAGTFAEPETSAGAAPDPSVSAGTVAEAGPDGLIGGFADPGSSAGAVPDPTVSAGAAPEPSGNGDFKRYTIPGDFNSDGRPDLLFQSARGNLAVWLLDGLRLTQSAPTNPLRMPGEGWRAVGTQDFDRDGYTDILFFNAAKGILAIWHMDALELLYQSEIRERVFDAVPVSILDFNRDSQPDILLQTYTGELVVLILGGTDVVEKIALDVPLGYPHGSRKVEWTAVGSGDFNGDGTPDIVLFHTAYSPCGSGPDCQRTANDLVAVALVSGTAAKIVVVREQLDRNKRIGAVGDYDGDFRPDLVLYDTFTRETEAWVMEGLKIRQEVRVGGGAPGVIVGPR